MAVYNKSEWNVVYVYSFDFCLIFVKNSRKQFLTRDGVIRIFKVGHSIATYFYLKLTLLQQTNKLSLVHNRTHVFLIVRFLASFQFFGIAYVFISS